MLTNLENRPRFSCHRICILSFRSRHPSLHHQRLIRRLNRVRHKSLHQLSNLFGRSHAVKIRGKVIIIKHARLAKLIYLHELPGGKINQAVLVLNTIPGGQRHRWTHGITFTIDLLRNNAITCSVHTVRDLGLAFLIRIILKQLTNKLMIHPLKMLDKRCTVNIFRHRNTLNQGLFTLTMLKFIHEHFYLLLNFMLGILPFLAAQCKHLNQTPPCL